MEENIIISNLNDFIFCPRSIYFHNLYRSFDETMYHSTYQVKGRSAHRNIDNGKYSTKNEVLQGIEVYSEELGVVGRIDLFDKEKKTLIERKNRIETIYEGYVLQIHAQYFCLIEMGYEVKRLFFHSLSDNNRMEIPPPTLKDMERLKQVILEIKEFNLEDSGFSQNPNKCRMCIYRELCDYYKNDE